MKKENIFLAITFILPVIFVLTMWGYYSYYSGKLNPQYDFVYVAPFNNPYFGYKDNKPIVFNPFEIQDNGDVSILSCEIFKEKNKESLVKGITGSSDDQTLNNCSSTNPNDFTYYKFNIKERTSKQIDLGMLKNTKFSKGLESPDGYTFKGDATTQPDFSSNYTNPFAINAAKFNNATLTNKTGANVSFELKENPFNRLFVGWIKN
jgi:hypothetical protein